MDNCEIFDKIQTFKRGVINIDLDAVKQNLVNMKANIDTNTKIMAVIKTNAYGHGCIPIAKMLEDIDFVYGYAVATAEEAMILRDNNIVKPILIIGYTFPYAYEYFIENDIRPSVFRKDMIDALSEIALSLGKTVKVHIKVDTGMSRIGVFPDDSGLEFIEYAHSKPGIEIEGIFTHFAKADEIDKTSAYEQLSKFNYFINRIEKEINVHIPIKHCSNSAGIIEIDKANMDIVRAGIILYGLYPSNEVNKEKVLLSPVLSLKSTIVHLKTIHKGMSVSYGGTYTAQRDTLVATVPLGYGDGYPRSLSNKGYVLIRGQRAKILGRVCMDQFMVDVSDIQDVSLGDSVTLIGFDGNEHISAEELGELSGRFNYELVCDLNNRIPRVYYQNNTPIDISTIV